MVTWFSMGSQDKGEIAASSASGARTDGRAQAKQCHGAPASHQRTNAVDEMPKVRTRTIKLMEENTRVDAETQCHQDSSSLQSFGSVFCARFIFRPCVIHSNMAVGKFRVTFF